MFEIDQGKQCCAARISRCCEQLLQTDALAICPPVSQFARQTHVTRGAGINQVDVNAARRQLGRAGLVAGDEERNREGKRRSLLWRADNVQLTAHKSDEMLAEGEA